MVEVCFLRSTILAISFDDGTQMASMLLLTPGVLSGAILFRAMVPLIPETQPNLSSVRVWIGAGTFDPIVPASETKQLTELLRGGGADVTIRFFQGGHELTHDDVQAAREWLATLK